MERPTRDGAAVARAVDALRYRILTGTLGAGEQLRQERMAEELEISRVPIREALRVLADQGLLEHRVHTGYFVKKRPAEELRQIFVMLEFLESRVMETLEEAPPSTIEELTRINDEIAEYVPGPDWGPMADLNRRFHFMIFRLSPLKVILEELERLWTIAAPYIAQRFIIVEMRRRTVEEHYGLIEALAAGELKLLEQRLVEHRSRRATLYE